MALTYFAVFNVFEPPLVLPYLLDDTRRVMSSWGDSGKFDPFEKVYEVSARVHPVLNV